jgi:leucyl aminopeptidase
MPTLVLLGKGVTHDTGAYNLKRSRLHDMSYDKAGAAAVVGAMHAIARLALPVRVIGLAPLVENLIDAKAFKPGDILTALDGTTVFVENTDAEGRLVLADCLVYARRFEPDLMIDVATLTDAATVALGDPYAALFTNDDAARELMVAAGEECGELLWPMPIHAEHVAALRHHRARLRNIGSLGGAACSAAAFLRQFVDSPWVHVDMGDKGVATHERDDMGPGATGYGTRLLVCAAQAFARRYAATEQESV